MAGTMEKISNTTKYRDRKVILLDLEEDCTSSLENLGIMDCAYTETSPPFEMIRRGALEDTHFNLVYNLEGTMLLETDTNQYRVNPGDFIYIPSWENRRFVSTCDSVMKKIFIRIRGESKSILKYDRVIVQSSREYINISAAFLSLADELGKKDKYSKAIARLQSELFGYYLMRELQHLNTKSGSRMADFHNLWNEIQKNPQKNWTIEEMAAFIGVSSSHIFTLTKDLSLPPPIQKLREIRMNLAKTMLLSESMKLSDIAHQIGYTTEFAFSKAFKKQCSVSPGQYRKLHGHPLQ